MINLFILHPTNNNDDDNREKFKMKKTKQK